MSDLTLWEWHTILKILRFGLCGRGIRRVAEHSDLDRDLILLRVLEAPRFKIWRAWTQPVMIQKWLLPPPMRCQVLCLDPRPGGGLEINRAPANGIFEPHFVGCFLDVEVERRLVFTDSLLAGYRPSPRPSMTVEVTLEDHERGTAQTIRAMCKDRSERDRLSARDFYENWENALDVLAELARWRRPTR